MARKKGPARTPAEEASDGGRGGDRSPTAGPPQPPVQCAHYRLVINWHWVEPLLPFDYFDLQVRDPTGTAYVLSPSFDEKVEVVRQILTKLAEAWADRSWSFTAGPDRVITG
jgi:hypothetical protein